MKSRWWHGVGRIWQLTRAHTWCEPSERQAVPSLPTCTAARLLACMPVCVLNSSPPGLFLREWQSEWGKLQLAAAVADAAACLPSARPGHHPCWSHGCKGPHLTHPTPPHAPQSTPPHPTHPTHSPSFSLSPAAVLALHISNPLWPLPMPQHPTLPPSQARARPCRHHRVWRPGRRLRHRPAALRAAHPLVRLAVGVLPVRAAGPGVVPHLAALQGRAAGLG